MRLKEHRKQFEYHGDKLKIARKRYALLVRPYVEAATSDEERLKRLWSVSVRAVEIDLWKYPVAKSCKSSDRKYDGAKRSREACYAILARWFLSDKVTDPERWRDNWQARFWGKVAWLHKHGWTACGEQSDKYKQTEVA